MLGRDHALMGAAGTLAVAPALGRLVGSHLGPAETAVAGVVGAGFALLPDLDEPGSTVARKFGLVSEAASHVVHAAAGGHRQATHSLLFAAVVTAGLWGLDRRFVWAAPVVLAACLVVAGRFVLPLGAGKGALGALVLPVAAGWWAWRAETGTWDLRAHIDGPHAWAWLALAAGAGVCLHMAGDVLTAGGVPLLWPLRWRVAVPLLGHTSSLRESFAGALLAVGVLLLTWVQVVGPATGHGGPVP